MRKALSLFSAVLVVLLSISGANAAGSNTGGAVTYSEEGPLVPQEEGPSPLAPIVTLPVPGTGAPATTLGPFTMTKVPTPGAPACTHAIPPLSTPAGAGTLGVVPTDAASAQRCIGSGWATWSHGYVGDVYYTGGTTSQTLTMPPNTGAFYFYVEPNPFQVISCSATATGSSGTASTGSFAVDGNGGARYVGFHETGGTITKIDVSCATDFATGEYGWAAAQAAQPGVCIQTNGNGVKFHLFIGQAGDAIVVNGFRADPGGTVPRTALEGTGFVNPDGSVVLGWVEDYAWGTGAWICPIGDTVIKVSGSTITHDTTYLGASGCPTNVKGSVSVISCTGLSASGGEAAGAEANMR